MHPVMLDERDELPEPRIELVDQEPIERQAAAQQPFEGFARKERHPRIAQGHDLIGPRLSLQYRAFTEPAARRDPDECRAATVGSDVVDFGHALDHAKPVQRGLAFANDHRPCGIGSLDDVMLDAMTLLEREADDPCRLR